jgi:hypothetical protein
MIMLSLCGHERNECQKKEQGLVGSNENDLYLNLDCKLTRHPQTWTINIF